MDEAVIVIPDLYLHGAEHTDAGALTALEYAGRFGERTRLAGGWRSWLAVWLGRGDLAGVSVAAMAAAARPAGSLTATRWIATPVTLIAGLTRAHLDRAGILRLLPEEQTWLVSDFQRTFGGSDLVLEPLRDGQLLLTTPAMAAIASAEPARCAGGELTLPQGPAAAPLLRLIAEVEMWLHGAPLNDTRAARGAPRVTSLWLWGAEGGALPAAAAAPRAPGTNGPGGGATLACGADAFLDGLAPLAGALLEALPESSAALIAERRAARAVLLAGLADAAPESLPWSLSAAVSELDRRLIRPALDALMAGRLGRLTLIANDTRIALGRHSALKRWRRPRPGLGAFVWA